MAMAMALSAPGVYCAAAPAFVPVCSSILFHPNLRTAIFRNSNLPYEHLLAAIILDLLAAFGCTIAG